MRRAEFDRIQFQLRKRQVLEEERQKRIAAKEQLHALSQERVKEWGNTIQGQRARSLRAFHQRKAKQEEEKTAVDLEEAKFQAQKRTEAIEKAKTQLYYQSDRIKAFHGALVMTEVLKERDAQLELKRLMDEGNKGEDKEEAARIARDLEEEILRDQKEAAERHREAMEAARFQKQQIRIHLKAKDKEREQGDIEGQELKRLAAEYHKERLMLDEMRRKEATMLAQVNRTQLANNEVARQANAQQEEEEDEECRIFAAAKRKMTKMRIEKEREIHKEKQDRLDRMREKIGSLMKEKEDDEDERIKKAQKEMDEKTEREFAMKLQKQQQRLREMGEHRVNEMKRDEKQKAMDRLEAIQSLRACRDADALFHANEDEKNFRKFEEKKELKGFHSKQIKERQDNDKYTKDEMYAQDMRNLELLAMEEAQFQEYAKQVIETAEKRGRNTYPLRAVAKPGAGGGHGPIFEGKGGIRPSYMVSDATGYQLPHFDKESSKEIQEMQTGPTNRRLGFVW